MTLSEVLSAQRSGDLDLLPGSKFNHPSPLTIEDGTASVMLGGEEWYCAEIDEELIVEALKLIGVNTDDVIITDTQIVDLKRSEILFSGDDISDLFAELAVAVGIYVEIV